MRIRERIEKTDGINRAYHIRSEAEVVQSHAKLGEWAETQLLQEELLKNLNVEGTHSAAVETIKNNLTSAFWN